MTTRRLFLKSSGAAMFAAGTMPLWLQRAAGASSGRKKVLVAIFQRGAMDGLSAVVPFGESNYAKLRPSIAIPSPTRGGNEEKAIDLDGFFGLHPAMAPLKPIFDAKQLAIVHAVGSPDLTRSHFDAQDYMESGTPGRKSTSDGWLNRAMAADPKPSPVRAVSMGPTLARTLRGANAAVALRGVENFGIRDDEQAKMMERMYAGSEDKVLQGAGKETFEAMKLLETIRKQPYSPSNGVTYPNNQLGQSLSEIARLIRSDVGLEVAFADMGGWDTHSNQPNTMQNLLGQFSAALAAFHRDLGDRLEDVAVVTMSEFGRTAKENGARGTDHGHANVMFSFGGSIRGGKVYGDWPGLDPDQMHQQRDLAVTTDFRDVLAELVQRHLGGAPTASVFPGYNKPRFRGLTGV